jgi:hypothetical protein
MNEQRWSSRKAEAWFAAKGWLVGCNFIPSSAINQLEMWQEDSFDAETIDRELGWAHELGMRSVRVYLHDLLWESDSDGFSARIETFLAIAQRHEVQPMIVLFDDCWHKEFALGPQPKVRIGVHNGGWLQSPGLEAVVDSRNWARLERYVSGVIRRFGQDPRVLCWDLYNEPGAGAAGIRTLPLLQKAFDWARASSPNQPLTAGIWGDLPALNEFQLGASDIVSFHNYKDVEDLKKQIALLEKLGRPLLCTEYLSRPAGCRFQSHLPVFKAHRVACYNWGLVSGKTQTIYAWGLPEGTPEPELWFHDILRADGKPFDHDEVALMRALTAAP